MTKTLVLMLSLCVMLALPGCRNFPEIAVSEQQFDATTPYPEFVPMDVLLREPEATITDELEGTLTARRDSLQASGAVSAPNAAADPMLDRIDSLRAKRSAAARNAPIIDEALRKRLEGGITPPTVPE